MKFFLDTEFIEAFHKPLFGKRRHFIDLVSIGIVCEDGRKYYAISDEFDPKDADQWVKDNVLSKLPNKNVNWNPQGGDSPSMLAKAAYYKSNARIADEIWAFVNPVSGIGTLNDPSWNKHLLKYNVVAAENRPVEFYAYYADYDWVLFCSLFGRMIDLPIGFPMYCRDIKQMMDEKGVTKDHPDCPKQNEEHNALMDAAWNKAAYEWLMTL